MQTIIMTVGTSLLNNQKTWKQNNKIGDRSAALEWLSKKFNEDGDCLERLSAETNTLWQLDPEKDDKIILFMYQKNYGIIETIAPLHVGASAVEETGNLNLIFRDQFTQTGIIPGSSIRGRFRADMRSQRLKFIEKLKR